MRTETKKEMKKEKEDEDSGGERRKKSRCSSISDGRAAQFLLYT